jgi:hypothetical protein
MQRHSRFLTAGVAALAALFLFAIVAFAKPPLVLVRVSTDPYSSSGFIHQTEVEPDTFSYGNTIVSTFQVGRATAASGGGCTNIGWATSTDSGATWSNGFLPATTTYATPPGPWGRVSDPTVAYDAMHNVWLINYLPINAGGTVLGNAVSRSTDGGLTWGNPINMSTTSGLDKNWIVCDNYLTSPYRGRCYGEWDNNAAGNLMQMSTSTDGGLTWGPAMTPSGSPSGLGGQPVVQPNGNVIVPYSANNSAERSFRSTNGGASWSAAVTIASIVAHGVAGSLRTSPLPSAEVSSSGKVYVAWQDCRFRTGCSSNDIVFSTSLDGQTWSAVTRIPIDAVSSTVDHFIPGIAVETTRMDPVDHLGLAYYYYPVAACTSATCQLYAGFVSSTDSGLTWTTPTQLAGPMTLSWIAQSNQGPMVGDYISTSFTPDGKAHPVIAVANPPGALLDEAMYSPVPGLSLELPPSSTAPPRIRTGDDKPVYFAPSDRPLPNELPTAH